MERAELRIHTESLYGVVVPIVNLGSITPTTHRERKVQSSVEDETFIDRFVTPGDRITVIRFGIRTITTSGGGYDGGGGGAAGGAGSSFAAAAAAALITESASAKSGASGGGGGGGSHGRASTAKTTSSKGDKLINSAKYVTHTEVEKKVFKEAVEYLLADESHRTVLVDIFERDLVGGELKLRDNSTHTVVLYRNPKPDKDGKTQIVVIDPSNSEFSLHLSSELNDDIIQELGKGDLGKYPITIIAALESYRIYNVSGVKGRGSDQFRDCVDIAVKIAFYLNCPEMFENKTKVSVPGGGGGGVSKDIALSTDAEDTDVAPSSGGAAAAAAAGGAGAIACRAYYSISPDKMKDYPVIQAIKMDSKRVCSWYNPDKPSPVKARQSSDPESSAAFYLIEKALDLTLKILATLVPIEVYDRYKGQVLTMVRSIDSSTLGNILGGVSKMAELKKTFSEIIVEHMHKVNADADEGLRTLVKRVADVAASAGAFVSYDTADMAPPEERSLSGADESNEEG